MAQKLFGKAVVQWNGKRLMTKPGASIDIGGVTRTTVLGDNDVNYTEQNKQAVVSCEMMLAEGFSLRELADAADISVVFKCDSGQSYLVSPAWLTAPPVATGGDNSSVPLTFEGPAAQEI